MHEHWIVNTTLDCSTFVELWGSHWIFYWQSIWTWKWPTLGSAKSLKVEQIATAVSAVATAWLEELEVGVTWLPKSSVTSRTTRRWTSSPSRWSCILWVLDSNPFVNGEIPKSFSKNIWKEKNRGHMSQIVTWKYKASSKQPGMWTGCNVRQHRTFWGSSWNWRDSNWKPRAILDPACALKCEPKVWRASEVLQKGNHCGHWPIYHLTQMPQDLVALSLSLSFLSSGGFCSKMSVQLSIVQHLLIIALNFASWDA